MSRVLLLIALASALISAPASAQVGTPLARDPQLGLACRDLAYPCSRLGVAVWVRHRAKLVTVRVDGYSVALRTVAGRGAYARGLFWQGFFNDPRAETYADAYPHLLSIKVRLVTVDGTPRVARARVPVSSGYG